jgi:hypothetical protein
MGSARGATTFKKDYEMIITNLKGRYVQKGQAKTVTTFKKGLLDDKYRPEGPIRSKRTKPEGPLDSK